MSPSSAQQAERRQDTGLRGVNMQEKPAALSGTARQKQILAAWAQAPPWSLLTFDKCFL